MAAASRSSSAAPSRSEQRTWSTTHRPGAIWASEVSRDEGGGAACGGVAGGVAACCGGGAEGCAHAARLHTSRTATSYRFISIPLSVVENLSNKRPHCGLSLDVRHCGPH